MNLTLETPQNPFRLEPPSSEKPIFSFEDLLRTPDTPTFGIPTVDLDDTRSYQPDPKYQAQTYSHLLATEDNIYSQFFTTPEPTPGDGNYEIYSSPEHCQLPQDDHISEELQLNMPSTEEQRPFIPFIPAKKHKLTALDLAFAPPVLHPHQQQLIKESEERLKQLTKDTKLSDYQLKYINDHHFRQSGLMKAKNNKACQKCKAVFTNMGRYAFHFQDHCTEAESNSSGREYCDHPGCPHTTIGFSNKYTYYRHRSSLHGKNKIICPRCNKEFSRKDGLHRHMKQSKTSCQPEKVKRGDKSPVDHFDMMARTFMAL